MVEETPNTLLFTATRNEDREDRFKWVGPINNRAIKLWRLVNPVEDWKMSINRSSNEAALRSIKEGRYMIGATSGDASHKNLKDQGYKVFSSPKVELSIKQLLAGRFPIISGLEMSTAMRLKNEGVAVFNDQYSYYYMVNKDTDCNVIYRLQKALDILKYNGVYKSIKNKWLQ
jgi:ABC-type amino acid transport substrate-binding protein